MKTDKRECPQCHASLERYEDPVAVKMIADLQRQLDAALEHQEVPYHTCAGKDCKNKHCQMRRELEELKQDHFRLQERAGNTRAEREALEKELGELAAQNERLRDVITQIKEHAQWTLLNYLGSEKDDVGRLLVLRIQNALSLTPPASIAKLKQRVRDETLEEVIPQCPWPPTVWPMTEDEYVASIPDEKLRTAISGMLMRKGWQVACKDISEAILAAKGKGK